MKTLILLVLLSSLSTFANSAQAVTACAIAGDDGIAFRPATQQKDREYMTLETVVHKGVRFSLKVGHGVARLEAAVNGKLVANTFYSYGRDPQETDSLRLNVLAPNGRYVEAQCTGVDAHLPE